MRVLFTGSRNWVDPAPVQHALEAVRRKMDGQPFTVVHGGARGLDALAGKLAASFPEVTVEAHPANWDALGKKAGFVRNQKMVDLGAEMVFAFPLGGNGTYDCMRRARAASIKVLVFQQCSFTLSP